MPACEVKRRIARLRVICRVWMFLADLDDFCSNEIVEVLGLSMQYYIEYEYKCACIMNITAVII